MTKIHLTVALLKIISLYLSLLNCAKPTSLENFAVARVPKQILFPEIFVVLTSLPVQSRKRQYASLQILLPAPLLTYIRFNKYLRIVIMSNHIFIKSRVNANHSKQLFFLAITFKMFCNSQSKHQTIA